MAEMNRPNILVIGSINADLVVLSSRIPQPGETVTGGTFLTAAGGKGANQAVAAARLGAACRMLGRVGADAFGRDQLGHLQESGIDIRMVKVLEGSATGVALIVVDEHGENAICVASGANHDLSADDVEAVADEIAAAQVCLLQLELPVATVVRAIELCRRLKVTSILDTAPAPSSAARELFQADIISPNTSEAELLTGMEIDAGNDQSVRAVAERLMELGARQVVLKLGSAGAAIFNGQAFERIPGYRVEAIDTTAAGDAFTAALGVAIARGESLATATRFANGAGAAACLTLGAQPSMPSRETVERLITAD